MKYIKKQAEPRQLTEFRNKGGTWETFALNDGKKEVKEQLLAEQKSLCAYCTESISFDTMKIEHWLSRDKFVENALDYSNLLGVCKGTRLEKGKVVHHCDTSKENTQITVNPQSQSHINYLTYPKNGAIKSSNQLHQKELDEVLNLNLDSIKGARKTVLNTLKIHLDQKYKGRKANYTKILKAWQNQDKPHGMVVIQYLERKMNALG